MPPIPPTVPKHVALRRLIPFARNPLWGFGRYLDEYGPSFFLKAGRLRRTLITTDPDIIQHALQKGHRNYDKSEIQTDQMARYLGRGLLTNSGEDWLRQRRLIQPGFHRERLRDLVDLMQGETEAKISELIEPTVSSRGQASGSPINIHDFTTEITFSIIARTIFTDGFSPEQTAEINSAVIRLQSYIIYPIRLPFLRPLMRITGHEQRYQKLSRDIGRQLLQRAKERQLSDAPKSDLLQMLLDSRYEDNGEPMTDQRLIDEIMILFAAGHETSANALAWTLYLLANHLEILEKCQQEVEEKLGTAAPNLENLAQLTYLQQVIEESMRLFPPAWVTDRIALVPNEVMGIPLEKDDVIVPYIYGLHRSPFLYDAPDEFRPERMEASARRERHPFSYIPFGGGPRLCIGNHFAMLEMKIVLLNLLRLFHFRRCDPQGKTLSPSAATKATITPKALITLRPGKEILISFQRKI